MNKIELRALNVEIPAGPVPEWIELIPAGPSIAGRDGRKWVLDRPDDIVAAFNQDERDIVIDMEHATEIKAPAGDPAPAAGWIRGIEVRNGAIWGRVEWTPAGAVAIENREYRYVSPVFSYEPGSGRIRQLLSVGLTNRPNLRLQALNRQRPKEEEMFKRLLAAIGLAEDATEDQAVTAVSTLKADLATARNRAEAPDLAKFVPRADYDNALSRAANAEKSLSDRVAADMEREITIEIDAALKAGKITPATKDYHMAMCRQKDGLAEFRKFVSAAPVIGDASGLTGTPPGTQTAMNAEQMQIAKMFGNSAEDIAKYGK